MISNFSVKNFRGFRETLNWNFCNKKNYEFNVNAVEKGIVKNGLIYGPNGSGKSNLGIALFDIVGHLTDKWKEPTISLNFLNLSSREPFASFSYTFKLDDDLLVYKYEKNAEGFLHSEFLSVNDKIVINRTEKIFSLDPEFPVDLKVKRLFTETPIYSVSIIKFLLTSIPFSKKHYLVRLSNFVNSMLWFRSLDSRSFIGLENQAGQNIEEYIIRNNLIDDYSDFLERLSGQRFHFMHVPGNTQNLVCNFGERNALFSMVASTGTKTLELLYFWIKHLSSASFVFIDEFDAFYHFELADKVCRELFYKSNQVFLTTHNTYLMNNDLLRPDCLFLLNNNEIKPLCDCTEKELRVGHNLEKMFRAGSFS